MKRLLPLVFLSILPLWSSSQSDLQGIENINKLSITVKKLGVYFGFGRGQVNTFQAGMKWMHKQIKIKEPPTHGVHAGFDYNVKHNVLGFEAGYWYKSGRISLTYGGDIVLRTSFDQTRLGAGPAIGFRMLGFHLQTGYHFLRQFEAPAVTNDFFIRLRFTLIKDRDVNFDRTRRKKKK